MSEHVYYPMTPEIERLGEEEIGKPVDPWIKAELKRWRDEMEAKGWPRAEHPGESAEGRD